MKGRKRRQCQCRDRCNRDGRREEREAKEKEGRKEAKRKRHGSAHLRFKAPEETRLIAALTARVMCVVTMEVVAKGVGSDESAKRKEPRGEDLDMNMVL